jgi:hypothetical protein
VTRPAVALGALVVALVAACGDDGSTETIDSGQAAPEQAVTTSTAPDEGGDGSDGDGGDHDGDGDDGDRDDEGGLFDLADAEAVDCGEDDSPSVSGNEEAAVVTGHCREVTIAGNGHTVLVESADLVEISGSDHRVVVESGDEIVIDGAGHDVRHPPLATVDNTSADSHVASFPVVDDDD